MTKWDAMVGGGIAFLPILDEGMCHTPINHRNTLPPTAAAPDTSFSPTTAIIQG